MMNIYDAIELNNHSLVEELIKNGTDPNESTEDGWTVLMFSACKPSRIECLNVLLRQPCIDVNKIYKTGITALWVASYWNIGTCLDALLKHKDINIYAENYEGVSALSIAVKRENVNAKMVIKNAIRKDIYKFTHFCNDLVNHILTFF